jgi:L-asparaginase
MDALTVAVVRGGEVESRHRVHAARVDASGWLTEERGDAGLVTFMRSAAKPIQALLLVRSYDDLEEEDIAIASASHHARAEQLAAVRELLARAGATEEDLECGPVNGSRLEHNCSGKHAGFLCVCAAQGWPFADYRLREHPLQIQVLTALDEADSRSPSLWTAVASRPSASRSSAWPPRSGGLSGTSSRAPTA